MSPSNVLLIKANPGTNDHLMGLHSTHPGSSELLWQEILSNLIRVWPLGTMGLQLLPTESHLVVLGLSRPWLHGLRALCEMFGWTAPARQWFLCSADHGGLADGSCSPIQHPINTQ